MTSQAPSGWWWGGWMRKLPVFLLFMEASLRSEKKHEYIMSKVIWKKILLWIIERIAWLNENQCNNGSNIIFDWVLTYRLPVLSLKSGHRVYSSLLIVLIPRWTDAKVIALYKSLSNKEINLHINCSNSKNFNLGKHTQKSKK